MKGGGEAMRRRGGAAAGERGGTANPETGDVRGCQRAVIDCRPLRLISAFNTLNNWLAGAHRLGAMSGGCGAKELFRQ